MSIEDINSEAKATLAESEAGKTLAEQRRAMIRQAKATLAESEAGKTLAEQRRAMIRARQDEKASAAAREAARQLALRRAATAKPGEYSRLGKKGSAALWKKIGTGRARVVELKRRAAVRKRNARIRRQALVDAIRRAEASKK